MLVDMMSGTPILRMPYQKDFELFRSRLSSDRFSAIERELNSMIDGDEIHTAGWMPGSDWTDTVFQPIYTDCAKGSHELAAKAFGLFVWHVFMERPESWTSGKFEKDGEPIGSRTYFRYSAR